VGTWIPRLLAGAALIAATVWAIRITSGRGAIDFYQLYAHAEIAGRDYPPNLYDPVAQREIGEELYARAQDSGSAIFAFDATVRRGLDYLLTAPTVWIQYLVLLVPMTFALVIAFRTRAAST